LNKDNARRMLHPPITK